MEYVEKQDEPKKSFISEIIDCKKPGYLNAQKAPFRHFYGRSTCKIVRKTAYICTAVCLSYFLWKEFSSKNVLLVVSETLRLFVKILTPDEKYYLSVKASIYINQSKCISLQTKKYFLNFLLHFQNLYKIWNTLKKKMSLGGYFFLVL